MGGSSETPFQSAPRRSGARLKKERSQIQGRTRWRLAIALLVSAPAAGTIVFLIYVGIVALASRSTYMPPLGVLLLTGLMLSVVIGWPITLVFGLPAHMLLYRRRSRGLAAYIITGSVASLLVTVLFFAITFSRMPSGLAAAVATGISLVFFGAIFIGACAVFWLIRRPDRDAVRTADLEKVFS